MRTLLLADSRPRFLGAVPCRQHPSASHRPTVPPVSMGVTIFFGSSGGRQWGWVIDPADDYIAVITLGDGNSLTVNSAGVVGTPPAGASAKIVAHSGGGFDVLLSYTYAEELTAATFSVSVTDHSASTSQSIHPFGVADAALQAGALTPPAAVEGAPLSNPGPNLLANGGFETGDLSGWTETGNLTGTAVDGQAHGGAYGVW
jgi:hypothetical protein